jgi:hypothetical protein
MPLRLHGEKYVLGLVGAGLNFCCGPNVQLVYEGNVRFEHCYRLDLDPTIATSHREACWKDYLSRHTYAQTGDKIGYARQRLNELKSGQRSMLALNLDGGRSGAPRADTVPMPSSIHAAPPPRAPEAPAPSQTVQPKSAEAPVESECTDACTFRWNDCFTSCQAKHGSASQPLGTGRTSTAGPAISSQKAPREACSECEKAFKVCMQRCYR